MKILIFTLEVRTEEQGTLKLEGSGKHLNNRTIEQLNKRMKKGKIRQGAD